MKRGEPATQGGRPNVQSQDLQNGSEIEPVSQVSGA